MSLSPKIKILLIDDHQLFNDGLKSLLITEEEIEIVAQIFDAKNAFFEIQKHSPDVILLDINLPHKNGIELGEDCKKPGLPWILWRANLWTIGSVRKGGGIQRRYILVQYADF